ncbi:hypothetical protein GQ53DRAFT_891623 [Thozetella sp. PMI_491]|nr:hypothetical protein GQ53DRAFT_891623 [Thozetella sp. PMI_491]
MVRARLRQNRFWIKRYGWDDDGSPTSWSAPDGSLLIDSGDPAVNISSNPLEETTDSSTAPYCTPAGTNEYGDPLVDYTFPNEPYDDWLLDQGYSCNCDESGCDETSPSCCADNACPPCDCNEDGCRQDSPDCCADSTCQWAMTQDTLSNDPLLNGTGTGNTTARANLTAPSAKFSARFAS